MCICDARILFGLVPTAIYHPHNSLAIIQLLDSYRSCIVVKCLLVALPGIVSVTFKKDKLQGGVCSVVRTFPSLLQKVSCDWMRARKKGEQSYASSGAIIKFYWISIMIVTRQLLWKQRKKFACGRTTNNLPSNLRSARNPSEIQDNMWTEANGVSTRIVCVI